MDRDMYLQRARECREMAGKMRGADRQKLLKIADAWMELAKEAIAAELKAGIDVRPDNKSI